MKTFLNNAEIIEDENRLLDIANQCEPGEKLIWELQRIILTIYYSKRSEWNI